MASKVRSKPIPVSPTGGRGLNLGELLRRIWGVWKKPAPKPIPIHPITGPTRAKPGY
jgi:hypothetical protein